jgi:hypothetical protein
MLDKLDHKAQLGLLALKALPQLLLALLDLLVQQARKATRVLLAQTV